jgi:hypothetical protein
MQSLPEPKGAAVKQSDIDAINAALTNISKWSKRPEWAKRLEAVVEEHVGQIETEFELGSRDELIDEIGPETYVNGVLTNAFEDFLTRGGPPDEEKNVVDDYLRRRGYREVGTGRRYLEALRDSSISFYEVLESDPGGRVVLRDRICGGEPIQLNDGETSRHLVKWDRVACRILNVNGEMMISGAPLPFDIEAASDMEKRILAAARQAEPEMLGRITEMPDEVRHKVSIYLIQLAFAPTVTNEWLAQLLTELETQQPDAQNFDYDDLAFIEARWPIRPERSAALRSALDRASGPTLLRDPAEPHTWLWLDKSQDLAENTNHAVNDEIDAIPSAPGGTCPVTLRIDGSELLLETTSKKSAARGRAFVESLLAGMIGAPAEKSSTLDEIAEILESGEGAPIDEDRNLLTHVERSRQQDLQTLREWLDQPSPALDGMTPRQAAQESAMRLSLTDLLKGLENTDERLSRESGASALDYRWLWQELGIPRDDEPT